MRFNKNLLGFISLFCAFVVGLAAIPCSDTYAQTVNLAGDEAILTIGSKAPALGIETWFSDREGEFERTTEFEPGKIYLIDFWATWSTVSHPWMVKYADLQDRYFDDGLQIIRISDEDEDSVADFLELDVNGHAETIYAEWTLGYCVTTDPDRSVHEDYMVAAVRPHLPVVFIVGRTGVIEWIGTPSQMKKPLKEIIENKWDRNAFGVKMLATQRMNKLSAEVNELCRNGEYEKALKLIEELMKDAPDSKVKSMMAETRLGILLEIDGPNIAEAFKDVVENLGGNSHRLNEKAWSIVTREQGGKEIPPDLLEIATETAKRGVELEREKGNADQLGAVLDTHAHLVFLQGDLDRALEIQLEASEHSQQDGILEYLDELQNEKAKRESNEANAGQAAKDSMSDGEATEVPQSGESKSETKSADPDPAGVES